MNQKLTNYLTEIAQEVNAISSERKEILHQIAEYITSTDHPKLNFICTHNSRRSHLSHIWAHTLAFYFDVQVETFSGGTEATAFHPNAVAALTRAGFEIEKEGDVNPRYQVFFEENQSPIIAYSKRFEESPNPTSDFAAIMTCSEADAECPVVFGASTRIKLFYEDPKVADGTPGASEKYDERCLQIATEMYYVFSRVNQAT